MTKNTLLVILKALRMTIRKFCYCKNWRFRNNSGNVAAVLNPESCNCSRAVNIGNNCYCRQPRIPPQLFSKPREYTVDYEVKNYQQKSANFVDYPRISEFVPPNKNYKNVSRVRVKPAVSRETYRVSSGDSVSYQKSRDYYKFPQSGEIDLYKPEQSITAFNNSKRLSSESLQETKRNGYRSDFDSDDSYNNKIKDFITEDIDEESYENTNNKNYNPKTFSTQFLYNSQGDDKINQEDNIDKSNSHNPQKSKLQDLVDFRNDHYFETHSTEDLIKEIPDHICVHQFGLDNRLLPEPLHSDSYGTSRCIICDKIMENPKRSKVDERISDKKKNVLSKYYKYGLLPKKIYMGGNDRVKLEMKLNGFDDDFDLKCLKKPNYYDTYALIYQKGVA